MGGVYDNGTCRPRGGQTETYWQTAYEDTRLYSLNTYMRAFACFLCLFLVASAAIWAQSAELQSIVQTYSQGRVEEAISQCQKLVADTERRLGPSHPDLAAPLAVLAAMFQERKQYDKAEPLYRRSRGLMLTAFGSADSRTLRVTIQLGRTLTALEKYVEAQKLCNECLASIGPASPLRPFLLQLKAEILVKQCDLSGLYPILAELTDLAEQKSKGTAEEAEIWTGLATYYMVVGDYARADELLRRSLRLQPPESPSAAQVGTYLAAANLQTLLGDNNGAEEWLHRAEATEQKLGGASSERMASVLLALAENMETRDTKRCEEYAQRCRAILEKLFGRDSPHMVEPLRVLASVREQAGQYQEAERMLLDALRLNTGEDAQAMRGTLCANLAWMYLQKGEPTRALRYQEEACSLAEHTLGPNNPSNLKLTLNLAAIHMELGHLQQVRELIRLSQEQYERRVETVLSFTSEQQRMQYMESMKRLAYVGWTRLADPDRIAEVVLRYKGLVLDSLMEDRERARTADKELMARLDGAKEQLYQLSMELAQHEDAALRARYDAMQGQVEDMERTLARVSHKLGGTHHALTVTVPQVQAALPRDGVLVEFLRFEYYVGRGQYDPKQRYGAVVVPPSGAVSWVPLGSAEEVDALIGQYVSVQRRQHKSSASSGLLRALYERLWAPLKLPPSTRLVVISPDSDISFVSFATLLAPDNHFLAEQCQVRYVASGRDLLRKTPTTAAGAEVFIGNPSFDIGTAPTTAPLTMRTMDVRDWQEVSMPPLPATARECQDLSRLLGRGTITLLGDQATEAAVRSLQSPRILHLATHGFFLPQEKLLGTAVMEGGSASYRLNPMHRSGLLLSGAHATVQAWGKGVVPRPDNDGVLTAAEVAALSLDGTWLVTLSACDTARGEARSGEGVLGLRRGFVQAGARHLLMTLWPVADVETAEFMVDFYRAAEQTKDPPRALAQVQRDWLVRLREQRGLEAAVQLAGPFIVSSQGSL